MKRKMLLMTAIILLIFGTTIFANTVTSYATESDECLYLSDIEYTSDSTVGWGSILYDKNYDGNAITLYVDGEKVSFPKGIAAHANSNVYYDLRQYKGEYDYFVAYAGIDASRGTDGDGVKLCVYTKSEGDTTWTIRDSRFETPIKGTDNAFYFKIELQEGDDYLRLQAYQINNNTSDHAVWADAKLIKSSYEENEVTVPTVAELDLKIANLTNTSSNEYQFLTLQRKLISSVGTRTLSNFIETNEDIKRAYNWLMLDEENLEMYILGGEPTGTYLKSLEVLGKLLNKYESDLSDTKYGSTYKTMMLAISKTHSTTVRYFISDTVGTNDDGSDTSGTNSKNVSDPVRRYEVYKKMMAEDKLYSSFYNLTVEEMRLVMNTKMSDYEIEWLRDYSYNRGEGKYLSYSDWWINYINQAYRWHDDIYYDADTIEEYSKKYGNFLDYGVTVEKYNPSIWMIYDSWGICWHISNTGACLVASQGVPTMTFGQPGHVSYVYFQDEGTGDTKYVAHYFVSNWNATNFTTYTGDRGYYVNRPYMNWGVGSYTSTTTNNASYVWLSQKALDNYDTFSESQKLVISAECYSTNPEMQKELYEKAIQTCKYNFDAYLNLAYLYRDNPSLVTDEQRYEFAELIVNNLGENPLPVNDLWTILNNQITDGMTKMKMSILRTNAVNAWEASTSSDVRNVATLVSGAAENNKIASFSFDGDNTNQIVLSESYSTLGVNWNYSLDGGNTWTNPTDKVAVTLTSDELASLNTTDGIKIHLMGTTTEEKNLFTIKITKATIPSSVCANDLENSVIGATTGMEWNIEGTDTWTSFTEETKRFEGDVTVNVKIKATGTQMESDVVQYKFTQDTQPDTKKYIYISNLSIDGVSSAQSTGEGAANVIDGRTSTIWHTNYDGDDEKWVTIKLDSPRYLSEIWYVPRQDGSPNGKAKSVEIYTSMNGQDWTLTKSVTDLANNSSTKVITLDEATETMYVKFKITENYGGGSWGSCAMINLFEDSTKRTTPIAGIEYSTTNVTNNNVSAKLVNPSTTITITNNDGSDTYTFTKNGEFTFEFEDEYGRKGTATATVNWIDKEAPVATITYSKTEETEEEVAACISFNEENVTITNNFGSNIYTFTKNGEFTFEFVDEAGNTGTATATVTWIKEKAEEEIMPGDVDGDSEITINDLALMKLYYIEKQSLNEEAVKAGDIDGDGEITINDIAIIKLVLIGLMELN
jgi:hypothetical protein